MDWLPGGPWPLVLLLVVAAGFVIWTIKRHRDPELHLDCDLPIRELTRSLAGLTLSTPVPGSISSIIPAPPSSRWLTTWSTGK